MTTLAVEPQGDQWVTTFTDSQGVKSVVSPKPYDTKKEAEREFRYLRRWMP